MSNPLAKEEGSNLLKGYRETKKGSSQKKERAGPNDAQDNQQDGDDYGFDAIADGSRLAMAYSHTKRATQQLLAFEGDKEISPLDMIRMALMRLNNVDKNEVLDDTNTYISTLLQGVEQHLETNNLDSQKARRSSVSARLSYEDYSGEADISIMNSSRMDRLNSSSMSMDPEMTAAESRVSNVFKENTMDLQESEAGYYENMANELVDQLEERTEERDSLQIELDEWQNKCDALEERLGTQHMHNTEALQSLTAAFEQEKLALLYKLSDMESTLKKSQGLLDASDAECESLQSEKASLREQNEIYDSRLSDLGHKLREASSAHDTLRQHSSQEIQRLKDELRDLAQSAANTEQSLLEDNSDLHDRLDESVHGFEDKIHSLRDVHARELQDLSKELDSLKHSERQLQGKLEDAHDRRDDVSSGMRSLEEDLFEANGTIAQLHDTVAGLELELNETQWIR